MRPNATFRDQRITVFVRPQGDKINFQSILATQQGKVVEGNRVAPQSALKTAGKETRKADDHTEVTCLQRDESDLQSALGALKREVAEGKQRLSPGIDDFKQWMHESSVNANALISDHDPSTSSSNVHQVLVHNALQKLRSKNWSSAYEDANKVICYSVIRLF